jgi:hypothetical protein
VNNDDCYVLRVKPFCISEGGTLLFKNSNLLLQFIFNIAIFIKNKGYIKSLRLNLSRFLSNFKSIKPTEGFDIHINFSDIYTTVHIDITTYSGVDSFVTLIRGEHEHDSSDSV